jgi:hypothetical protein
VFQTTTNSPLGRTATSALTSLLPVLTCISEPIGASELLNRLAVTPLSKPTMFPAASAATFPSGS